VNSKPIQLDVRTRELVRFVVTRGLQRGLFERDFKTKRFETRDKTGRTRSGFGPVNLANYCPGGRVQLGPNFLYDHALPVGHQGKLAYHAD
jgi:hypothetical protein